MIDIEVRGHGEYALRKALEVFDKMCLTTGLKKDVNRHRSAKKPCQRKREKHLKAVLKQRDINEKLLKKQKY